MRASTIPTTEMSLLHGRTRRWHGSKEHARSGRETRPRSPRVLFSVYPDPNIFTINIVLSLALCGGFFVFGFKC